MMMMMMMMMMINPVIQLMVTTERQIKNAFMNNLKQTNSWNA